MGAPPGGGRRRRGVGVRLREIRGDTYRPRRIKIMTLPLRQIPRMFPLIRLRETVLASLVSLISGVNHQARGLLRLESRFVREVESRGRVEGERERDGSDVDVGGGGAGSSGGGMAAGGVGGGSDVSDFDVNGRAAGGGGGGLERGGRCESGEEGGQGGEGEELHFGNWLWVDFVRLMCG